jgi:hypothetical protein
LEVAVAEKFLGKVSGIFIVTFMALPRNGHKRCAYLPFLGMNRHSAQIDLIFNMYRQTVITFFNISVGYH